MITAPRRLRLRHKVLLLPVTSLATVALLLAAGVEVSRRTGEILARVEEGLVPAIAAAGELELILVELDTAVREAVAAEDRQALAATGALRDRFLEELEHARALPGTDAARLGELATALEGYYAVALQVGERLVSRAAAKDAVAQASDMTRRYEALRGRLAATAEDGRGEVAGALEQARRAGRTGTAIAVGVTLAASALLLALASWVAGALAAPVAAMARSASRVARGDLEQRFAVETEDELADLALALQSVADRARELPVRLRDAAGELSRHADELVRATRGQTEAVGKQAAALARSKETAARIVESTADASGTAETVMQIASQADEVSVAATRATRAGLDGIGEIGAHADAVLAQVTQLAERTRAAAESVELLQLLATRSSELSLRVAVEAARAGDGGRELTEVSRDIRNVAMQMSQGLKRVRQVIWETERGVKLAANATAEARRRMERGLAQVRSSGDGIREMAGIIRRSSQLARGVVATASRQYQGVSEISATLLHLDRAVGETFTGVSTAERSAEALRAAAAQIMAVVDSFRVGDAPRHDHLGPTEPEASPAGLQSTS